MHVKFYGMHWINVLNVQRIKKIELILTHEMACSPWFCGADCTFRL